MISVKHFLNVLNRKKRRSYSISQTLSWFIASNILLLGFLIVGFTALRIDKVMETSQEVHVSSQVQALTSQLTHYLEDRQQILSDHARFPVFVQSLMQPIEYGGIAKDFMQDLNFLGNPNQEVLIDFRGKTVIQRQDAPLFDYSKKPWVQELLNEHIDSYVGISKNQGNYFWRIAKPVFFNGNVEGILAAEIPLEEITRELKLSNHLGGISFDIIWDDQILTSVGDVKSEDPVYVKEQLSGVDLRFYVDHSEAIAARNQLIIESLVLIVIIASVMAILSIFLGKILLVKPIEHLQFSAKELAKGLPKPQAPEGLVIREFTELVKEFTHMANKIQHREEVLQFNRDRLEKVNKDLKNSQAQLVQSEKMASLGILSAGVAHEINNPTSFVKSNINSLKEYLDKLLLLANDYYQMAEKQEEHDPALLEKIHQQLDGEDLNYLIQDIPELLADTNEGINRIQNIVQGLKSFVRSEEAEIKNFDVNECIESTLKIVWNELKYKCEISKTLPPLPLVQGNQGEINQVILNLLMNASQAIDQRGKVHIETGLQNKRVFIKVSDTGCGISDENLTKLFTPFFTTKDVGSGTGLGLSISHGIVKKHGGEIEVQSKVGEGTVFTVYLSALAAEAA